MAKIVYLHPKLVQEYGAGLKEVSDNHAEMLRGKGLAKIIDGLPRSNPKIKRYEGVAEKLYGLQEKDNDLSLYTHVSWLEDNGVDQNLLDIGVKCGYYIHYMTGRDRNINHLLLSDLAILNLNKLAYPTSFMYTLKVILFQKRLPFVLIVNDEIKMGIFEKQLITRAAINVFSDKTVMRQFFKIMNKLINPYCLMTDPYAFWREVSKNVRR